MVRAALSEARPRTDARGDDDEIIGAETLAAALERLIAALAGMAARMQAPSESEIRAIGTRAARVAARAQRAGLVRAGMPRGQLAVRLGVGEVLGIGLQLAPGEELAVSRWATQGAWYIRTAELDLFDDLQVAARELTERGAREGMRWETVARELEARTGISRRRAELIARDQTAKLNGRITEHTQTAAGITSYTWRSSHDQRVRDTHAAADGQVYEWAGPGAPGAGPYGQPAHPGQGINCRCTAEPVIPD